MANTYKEIEKHKVYSKDGVTVYKNKVLCNETRKEYTNYGIEVQIEGHTFYMPAKFGTKVQMFLDILYSE